MKKIIEGSIFLASILLLSLASAQLFSPPTEITASINISYAYEDILSLELYVSDISNSPVEYVWDQSTAIRYTEVPTRTASYNSTIEMHSWEKSFDGERSGTIRAEYVAVSRRASFEGDMEAGIEESPSWAKERYIKNVSIKNGRNEEIKLIEVNEEMQSLAESITESERRIYYASELIYEWIVDNIVYKVDDDPYPKGAMRTLKEGEGDCDDMSALFCSLARSIGIPCYMVDGYIIKREGALPYAHTWVGVIVPSEERIFDALPVDPAFREFGFKSANKIVTGFDPGSSEYVQKAYRAFKFTYENSDGTNGSAAIVAVASNYLDNKDPLYDIKKRSLI